MKKILFCFLLLIIIFIFKNQIIIKAEIVEDDYIPNTVLVKDFNKNNNINVKIFTNINKTYRRSIISFFNNKYLYAGKVEYLYTVYKYQGINFNYYNFFYNSIISPYKNKNNLNNFIISKNQVKINLNKGDYINSISPFKTNEDKVFYNKDNFSFYHDYNHREIDFFSEYNFFKKEAILTYEYKRNLFEFLFNKNTDFLKKQHKTFGFLTFKTKKDFKQILNIDFIIKMDYLYKFDNINYNINRDYYIF